MATETASADKGNCIAWDGPLDRDGIQLCPTLPANGPWALTRCAFQQATSFHAPTQQEKQNMQNLVKALKAHDAPNILNYSSALNLRVCRVKKFDDNKKLTDSYLVLATKPGVKNYSGPFIYFRELNPSNYVFFIPHDGTDGTCPSIEQVFDRTNTSVAIANGSPRDLSTQIGPCTTHRPISDIAHNTNNLAWTAHKAFTEDPDTMEIEFHGMKGTQGGEAPKGVGMIITNGLGRQAGPNTLLYAFATAIKNRFSNRDQAFLDTLSVCAPGTPLKYAQKCALRDTWVQGRDLNGSPNPQCSGSVNMSNRFVGFEQGQKLVQDPGVMTPVIKELEQTYPKPIRAGM
ncbi:MAG TPA: hypothetical protein VLG38_03285 [Gammaproteobacteria bacterium]|nr:hypothetical protein [Gammaproteobacteria bacterium]